MNFNINLNALAICQTFHNHGFTAYLVGGCIRDLLLGLSPKDWDIATSATPAEMLALFEKTYETGIQHGTISIGLSSEIFEATTFRSDSLYSDGRRPDEVIFVASIQEDLARRDFTINAIAYDPIYDLLIDPFNGQEDIKNGIIRAVGNAKERFAEDGLRLMRACRFASRFNFCLEQQTLQAMQESTTNLSKIAMERVQKELEGILLAERPSIGLELLYQTGLLAIACLPICQERERVGKGLFSLLNRLPGKTGTIETKLAFLCHSVPDRKQELNRLKLSSKQIKRIEFILFLWNSYLSLEKSFHQENGFTARLFLSHIQNETPDSFEETWQQFGYWTQLWDMDGITPLIDLCQYNIIDRKNLAIKGNDILQLGVVPGPMVKTMLNAAYEQILRKPEENTKKKLLAFLEQWLMEYRKHN